MPIDLDNSEDRRVATWLAAQSNPAAAVKKLILTAAAGKEPTERLVELLPFILQEVRMLRAELKQTDHEPDPVQDEILFQIRALRADLARVGPKELGRVMPPPEDPESTQRLDTLFSRR
jgi:hypothetical protein